MRIKSSGTMIIIFMIDAMHKHMGGHSQTYLLFAGPLQFVSYKHRNSDKLYSAF